VQLFLLNFVLRDFSIETAVNSWRGCYCVWWLFWLNLRGSPNVHGVLLRQVDDREAYAHHKISALKVSPEIREAGDFGIHHQRHNVALVAVARRIPLLAPLPTGTALPQAFDLDLSNGIRNPLGGVRLSGAKKDLGGWLRQHSLGLVAITGFELAAALEAKHKGDVGFAVLGNGGVQLRQSL